MADLITIDRAVAEQALEALQTELMGYDGPVPHIDSAISALRAALLEQQAERDALLSLIADDALASSFQTMAQYRSALLKATKGGSNG